VTELQMHLDGSEPSVIRELTPEIVLYLEDPTEESLERAITSIVAAIFQPGYSSTNTGRALGFSLKSLHRKEKTVWADLLAVYDAKGVSSEDLLPYSPWPGSTFVLSKAKPTPDQYLEIIGGNLKLRVADAIFSSSASSDPLNDRYMVVLSDEGSEVIALDTKLALAPV
jgi:hypothetical protein